MIAVDTTILGAVARCDTEAALRHALGLTTFEDTAPLQAGSAAHEALAVRFRGGSVDEALATFSREYEEWAAEHVADEADRLSHTNTRRVLAQWFATNPLATLPFHVPSAELVEVGFAVPLDRDGETVFVGRMDAVGVDSQDAWYVIEHKTTGRIDAQFRSRIRMSAQVSGYAWAAQQHIKRPVVGVMVNAIEFAKLPDTPTRKCREHGVVYAECGPLHARSECFIVQRTPEQLEAWQEEALRLAGRYERLRRRISTLDHLSGADMRGQFSGACPTCQFRDFCAIGRPLEAATTMLRMEPWEPYRHALGRRAKEERQCTSIGIRAS